MHTACCDFISAAVYSSAGRDRSTNEGLPVAAFPLEYPGHIRMATDLRCDSHWHDGLFLAPLACAQQPGVTATPPNKTPTSRRRRTRWDRPCLDSAATRVT